MLEVTKVNVMNLENAMRGARNPLNSWDKSDSYWEYDYDGNPPIYILGPNDLKLAIKLCNAGPDHRKFMRQIFVSMDVNAPLYWWKEFDTYKVGTCANSTSTMHTIHKQEITRDMFSLDTVQPCDDILISHLEELRLMYIATGSKDVWRALIQRLPSSFNQMRTVTLTYENLINIYHNRKNHKLVEWHVLCDAISDMPYSKELIIR